MSGINSLANFGVPGLDGSRSAVLQPIWTHHFRALFFNFGAGNEPAPYDLTRQMKKFQRPNVKFEPQTIHSYVSTVYLVNRGEWEQITMSFLDDIATTVARRVDNQIAKQMNFFDQTSSRAGENYKFEMDLDILAGGATAGSSSSDPNILRKYSFAGCEIIGTDLGTMDYDDPKAMEIGLTVRFDNCIRFDHNGNRMGTFSHTPEIQSRTGIFSTGIGAPGGLGVSISGASVNVGFSGVSLGGATVSGNIGTGGSSFGLTL